MRRVRLSLYFYQLFIRHRLKEPSKVIHASSANTLFTKYLRIVIAEYKDKIAVFFKWSNRESKPNGFDMPDYLVSGVDGSRTRVQKPIPCPSTIIVRFCGRLYPACSLTRQKRDNLPGLVAS